MRKCFFALLLFLCVLFASVAGMKNLQNKDRENQAVAGMLADRISDKTAFLTFDDGPSENTEEVLDILDKNHIKASFFLIGNQIAGREETVKREIEEEHSVGMHTFCHDANVIYQNASTYLVDLEQVEALLKEQYHYETNIYRFPYGSKNQYVRGFRQDIVDAMEQKGFHYVDWNVSGEDSIGRPSSSTIVENVKKDSAGKDTVVILLHDSAINSETVRALPEIIDYFRQNGYRFDVLR